jgi:hypothetical protein
MQLARKPGLVLRNPRKQRPWVNLRLRFPTEKTTYASENIPRPGIRKLVRK